MGLQGGHLLHSDRAGQPAQPGDEDMLQALTEFDSESVIATRRISIDADARIDRHSSSGFGYIALLAAFVLGVCTGLLLAL